MLHFLGKRAANQALIPENLSVKVYGHCVVCDGRTPCLGIAGMPLPRPWEEGASMAVAEMEVRVHVKTAVPRSSSTFRL